VSLSNSLLRNSYECFDEFVFVCGRWLFLVLGFREDITLPSQSTLLSLCFSFLVAYLDVVGHVLMLWLTKFALFLWSQAARPEPDLLENNRLIHQVLSLLSLPWYTIQGRGFLD
jgi:hypothetical protein